MGVGVNTTRTHFLCPVMYTEKCFIWKNNSFLYCLHIITFFCMCYNFCVN